MALHPELEGRINPVITLDNSIAKRSQELQLLSERFKSGLDLVRDLNRVNDLITASSRPDLVMTERVQQMPLDAIEDIGRLNNFIPNMEFFGVPIYGEKDKWTGDSERVGYREYTEEELAKVFLMGARGGYSEHLAFVAEHGIDEDFARYLIQGTHINNEAFMRMWILMPELTMQLMSSCLNKHLEVKRDNYEEIFVAYQLMSRLVDVGDRGAIGKNGTVDTWLLCH